MIYDDIWPIARAKKHVAYDDINKYQLCHVVSLYPFNLI